eukprot:9380893-Pyramimonas_sp.AAC.1
MKLAATWADPRQPLRSCGTPMLPSPVKWSSKHQTSTGTEFKKRSSSDISLVMSLNLNNKRPSARRERRAASHCQLAIAITTSHNVSSGVGRRTPLK